MPGSERPASAIPSSGRGGTASSASRGSIRWSGCSVMAAVCWTPPYRRRVPAPTGRVLTIDHDAPMPSLLRALAAALDASGPALLPVPAGGGDALRQAAALDEPVDPGAALLLATSGSGGAARVVELGADALLASAHASQERLGGGAHWLLALPLLHVAGWQVLVRATVAGTDPVALPAGRGFTPETFTEAASRLRGPRRCTSLVPTQLARVLGDPAATAAAAGFDAVLLGGAAASPTLLSAARRAGVRIVTTYGSTETAGGCVYDGRPLDAVRVRLDRGRVSLSGPVLARRYRGRSPAGAPAFVEDRGRRWYRTPDLGRLVPGRDGPVLHVLGRADDVLVTGGEKVAPAAVEDVLVELPGIGAAMVVGVADPEWGQLVVALVEPGTGAVPSLEEARAVVRGALGAPAAPRHLVVVDQLPALALGKPDRRAGAALAAQHVAAHH